MAKRRFYDGSNGPGRSYDMSRRPYPSADRYYNGDDRSYDGDANYYDVGPRSYNGDESSYADRAGRSYYGDRRSSPMQSRAEEMSSRKRYYDGSQGSYAGPEARRTQEMEDGGMIVEDRRSIANLPQDVMIKMYATPDDYGHYNLDDTIRSVDNQRYQDSKHKKKGQYPDMF